MVLLGALAAVTPTVCPGTILQQSCEGSFAGGNAHHSRAALELVRQRLVVGEDFFAPGDDLRTATEDMSAPW